MQHVELEDPVCLSLEMAGEMAGDISPAIYQNYFARCPGSEALMAHIDELVRGKMLEEVFRLLMLDDYSNESGYLNFEMKNHRLAYSVEAPMYGNLLAAIKETVESSLGDAWTQDFEQAWKQRLESLLGEIDSRL
jgi:hypothetical protein